jgi:protein TonB
VQTATGPSGQAELSGPAAAQPSQGADRTTTQRLMAQWGSGVQRAIERRKRYPRGTRASGTVRLRLTLNGAGQLTGIGLAASSGHTALDQAAMAAVRAARYPAAPEALGPGPHAFTVPLSFRP